MRWKGVLLLSGQEATHGSDPARNACTHMTPMLKTTRLTLRPLTRSDVPAVHRILGDERTTEAVSWGQPFEESTAAWVDRRISQQEATGFSMWLVLLTDDQPIGLAGFFPTSVPDQLELGYVIHADHWRNGYGYEAVSAVLALAEHHDVVATIRSTNAASIALAESLGLERAGAIEDTRGILLVFERPRRPEP